MLASGLTEGGGVTPDAVNWPDVSGTTVGSTGYQTITGITSPISLKITWTGAGTLIYLINGSVSAITNGGSLTVNNSDTLAFNVSSGTNVTGTVTVTNSSDSNTVLDTFTYDIFPVHI